MDTQTNQQSGISTMPIIAFGVVSLIFGLVVYIFYPSWGTLPVQASVQAERTDELFRVLMGLSGVVFFLVQGLIYYAAVAFRAKANDTSDGLTFHGNVMLEIIWTIVPSVIVVGIAIYAFFVWRDNTTVLDMDFVNLVNGEHVEINATGQRFAWSFEYLTNEEDDNGDPIVLNSSNLHTYVDQNVFITMETLDVIHSFWIPTMRVKQDLLPGRDTEIRFTTQAPQDHQGNVIDWEWVAALSPVQVFAEQSEDSEVVFEDLTETNVEFSIYPNTVEMELVDPSAPIEGEWVEVIVDGEQGFVATDEILGSFNKFRLVCTELCGSGHGNMFTYVYLWQSEEAMLDGWWDNQVEARRVPPAGPVDAGRLLLSSGQYPCSNCHVLSSLDGWVGALGPALDGVGSRADERAIEVGEDVISGAEYLAQSLRHPNAYLVSGYGANIMPVFDAAQMPQEDLNAIVAYLCTQTSSGDASASDCGLENLTFAEDGSLADVDALEAELTEISNEYE